MKALFFCRLIVLAALGLIGTIALGQKEKSPARDPLAAARARSVENLTRLVSALHQYHDRHHHFPPAARDAAGGIRLAL